MVESYLTDTRLLKICPQLADIHRSTETVYTNIIGEALTELVTDLKNAKFNIRKLCKRYSLQSSVTKTAIYTGTITSDEDYINRDEIVINVTALSGTGTVVFTLEGSDDDGTTYETVTTVNVTATGNVTAIINKFYKKYRLSITSIGAVTSITFSSYLIESLYETLHAYKATEMIYRSRIKTANDNYKNMTEEFYDLYWAKFNGSDFKYDENDDNEISSTESENDYREPVFRV